VGNVPGSSADSSCLLPCRAPHSPRTELPSPGSSACIAAVPVPLRRSTLLLPLPSRLPGGTGLRGQLPSLPAPVACEPPPHVTPWATAEKAMAASGKVWVPKVKLAPSCSFGRKKQLLAAPSLAAHGTGKLSNTRGEG